METVLVVCIVLITIAIIIGTVHFVLTMIQLRQTAKESENLTRKINEATQLLDLALLGGGLFFSIINKVKKLFNK
ncbi:MAG: hypothetical protein A2539_10575 [Elusimicrobia bacterium RIFOXYD2_FULL_34_15]|nr:MAG: hypothetical protein A2539_10575 [Elusimicrobia bacterium RIFOXYD2_FULL_34_15]